MNIGQRLIVWLIDLYQNGGGGLERLGVDCNFEPSCSEYSRQAVVRYGAWRGIALGWQRISRCTDGDCVCRTPDPLPQQD